jgi:trk system potassium uptake protein TrkH
VDQGGLTGSGKLISILLMLVGGSSGSTAGGIKTVTVGLLCLTAVRVLRNRKDIVVFRRKIPQEQVNSAVSITLLVVTLGLAGGVVISATNGVSLGDALYEAVSAICTVGLSTGITAGLNLGSKILLMLYMFFGRVGIMTISFAFMTKTPPDNAIGRPETRVLIG